TDKSADAAGGRRGGLRLHGILDSWATRDWAPGLAERPAAGLPGTGCRPAGRPARTRPRAARHQRLAPTARLLARTLDIHVVGLSASAAREASSTSAQ